MGFRCGLVGLPNVGKSTLFNALSAGHAQVANYPFTTIDPNRAIVAVPDARLHRLSRMLNPQKSTPSHLEFVDIAGLVQGASRGEGLGNQFLGHIRDVHLLVHVLRCFEDPDVAHVDGSIDPVRDLEVVRTELLLADLELLERRLEKTQKSAKGGAREAALELDRIVRFVEPMQRGVELRKADLSPEDAAKAREWGLLTYKPAVVVANVDEKEWSEPRILQRLQQDVEDDSCPVIPVCAALEAEITRLPEEDRRAFLEDMGMEESALNRIIRVGYRRLGLITFYTTVGTELRAWSLTEGASAPSAAGKIHSDMERGFIRAEVIAYESFLDASSLPRARELGLVRSEGKDYLIRDGDIVTFRFQA